MADTIEQSWSLVAANAIPAQYVYVANDRYVTRAYLDKTNMREAPFDKVCSVLEVWIGTGGGVIWVRAEVEGEVRYRTYLSHPVVIYW